MEKAIQVTYVEHVSDRTFNAVIKALEAATGSVEIGRYVEEVKTISSRDDFEQVMHTHEGSSGFMRFLTIDHGGWMRKFEGAKLRSVMYTIGNPLIARTMLRHDMAAGLNVPVRIHIYEGSDGQTRVGYYQPSSLMSAFGNEGVTNACRALDGKLAQLAKEVAGL